MTDIKGFFETKWLDTQGVCIKDQLTDKKGEWYGGKLVWKFVDFKKGDPIIYQLSDDGKNLKFIKSDDGTPKTKQQSLPVQEEIKHDDTMIWNKLIDIEEYVESTCNMVAGLVEDMEALKKHLNITREKD